MSNAPIHIRSCAFHLLTGPCDCGSQAEADDRRDAARWRKLAEGELRAALEAEVWAALGDVLEPSSPSLEFLGSQIIGGVLRRVLGNNDKACPFCGGTSVKRLELVRLGGMSTADAKLVLVACSDCEGQAPVEAWNNRATLGG